MLQIPPSIAEQAPYLVVLAVVIGWLLYQNHRDRREASLERGASSTFIASLVTRAEADRKELMDQWRADSKEQQQTWRQLLVQSIEVQAAVCKAIEDHEKQATQRSQTLLKVVERINGKA